MMGNDAGYSITSGEFDGGRGEDTAVGVPRGGNLTGMVSLMTAELGFIKNLTGSQVGSYFGASVAAGDVDGDGLDDVIVGAPLFTGRKEEGKAGAGAEAEKNRFEVGQVVVFFQGLDVYPPFLLPLSPSELASSACSVSSASRRCWRERRRTAASGSPWPSWGT